MNHAAPRVERMSWREICARHPDRWVVLGDVAWVNDTDFEFSDAELLAVFEVRKAASPTMTTLIGAGREVGCFWTGALITRLAR